MKRFLTLLSCAAALVMVGCTNDIDEGLFDGSASGVPAIVIDGSIHQTYTTRVDDGGFCGGDQVGLYGVNYTNDNSTAGTLLDEGNQVDNALYTYNEENRTWTARGGVYYKDANTNIDIYAYYPYGTPESVSAYPFEVMADQSGAGVVDGHSMSDFLWGKAAGVVPSSQSVKIKFQHRMAATQVVLEMGENWADEAEWNATKKHVLQQNVIRTSTIDLSTGEVTATGEVSSEGTLMRSTAEGWRCITVPQSVAALTSLFAIDIDGVSYRYKSSKDFTYESGKMHRFTIAVNKKSDNGGYELVLTDCQIVDWVADLESHGGEARQYYVVHLGEGEAGSLGTKIKAAGKNPDKIKNLKVSGEIDYNDFRFMRDNMEILQAVNLRESKIVAITWCCNFTLDGGNILYNQYFSGDVPATDAERQAAVQARYPDMEVDYHSYEISSSFPADEIPNDAFSGKQSLVYFVFPEKVTKIGDSAFYKTMLSGALIIPDDVVEIDNRAFANTLITSLELPYNLKKLGSNAFNECKVLGGTLSLPDGLESIGNACFWGCSSLTGELILPHGLKELPRYCFYWCHNLTGHLTIPEGVKSIGASAFDCCNFTGLTLPSTLVGEIWECAFSGNNLQGELVIPEGVTRIGRECFAGNELSSIVLPEGLLRIDEWAFNCNWRLCEPVVFPSTLQSIGECAFYDCRGITAIDLPADLTLIGENAFSFCYGISSIVSRAKVPPTVMSGAFDGVAKDNFTLEVPESAVVKYQTATGWSDFMRISAHHDFSFSRRLMRTLNAGGTKRDLILRAPAGKNWKVESKPDWVTINHTSGTGKVDDIVVTIAEMSASEVGTFEVAAYDNNGYTTTTTHAGRKGEIVFLLEGEEYRTSMVVEQYDYEYADGDVIVCQEATKGHGVDLVFLGDCFDAKDIQEGKYLDGVNEAIEHFFAIEPYKTYRNYFNVYTVLGVSPDSGVGTLYTIKEAKFGTQYTLNAGLTLGEGLNNAFEYTLNAISSKGQLKNTLITMVLNTNQYGGLTFMWGDGTAIALCPMSDDAYPYDFRGLVQHEAGGHGFAKLADEYIYHPTFITNCGCPCCNHLEQFLMGKRYGWYRNLSESGNMDNVPWSHLIFHDKYSNIVDIYEGGYFHARGIYRSEPTSCMNNNIPYFSAISRQTIVERIMKLANEKFSLADFYANDVLDASNNTRALQINEKAPEYQSAAAKQMAPVFMGESPEWSK